VMLNVRKAREFCSYPPDTSVPEMLRGTHTCYTST
jgi:hypothetical protein